MTITILGKTLVEIDVDEMYYRVRWDCDGRKGITICYVTQELLDDSMLDFDEVVAKPMIEAFVEECGDYEVPLPETVL